MSLSYRATAWTKSKLRGTRDKIRIASRSGRLLAWRTFARMGFCRAEAERMYPPSKIAATTAGWQQAEGSRLGAKLYAIDAATRVVNPMPKSIYREVRAQFTVDRDKSYSPVFVAEVPNGRSWDDGIIVTPDNTLLADISIDRRSAPGQRPTIIRDWDIRPLTKLQGTALVLATDGADLYYHWLFQALPRIELARRAGFDLANFDHVIVNRVRHRFQSDSLKALNIADSKIVEAGEQAHYQADRLVVPSIALEDGNFPDWMTGMLRRTFLHREEEKPTRTIYIARGKAKYRRVMNEDDVIAFMRSRDFEIVQMEQYSMAEQAVIMAQSKAVVAPHGGGLSNLVFCSPNTIVVELFSPELVAGYYWKLSNRMGLDYYCVLGRGEPGREKADYRQSWDARSDIVVDLDELKSTLDLAGL